MNSRGITRRRGTINKKKEICKDTIKIERNKWEKEKREKPKRK